VYEAFAVPVTDNSPTTAAKETDKEARRTSTNLLIFFHFFFPFLLS